MELLLDEPIILLEPEADNKMKTIESKVDDDIIEGILTDYYLLYGRE